MEEGWGTAPPKVGNTKYHYSVIHRFEGPDWMRNNHLSKYLLPPLSKWRLKKVNDLGQILKII